VLPDGLNKPGSTAPISLTKLLLVEGQDAFSFSLALLNHLELKEKIEIRNFGGISDLGKYLKTLKAISGFNDVESLAVARDAEANSVNAFQAACDAFQRAGFTPPPDPLIYSTGKPTTSVFIFPDCTQPGMLETLCLESVKDDAALPCVDQFLDCLSERGVPTPNNLPKSRLHAFLASRPIPNCLLGQAAHKGYFPWDNPAFEKIKQFLRSL